MSEANKELVRRHFEEINHQNLDACDDLMAEDYVEHAVAPFGRSEPGNVHGPTAMRATAEWLIAQFPDIHMTIEAIVAEGDVVGARVLSEGTNLGPLNGAIPPTGKRFRAHRVIGTASRTASSPNIGPRSRTFLQCCSSASSGHRARPAVSSGPSSPRRS